MKNNLSLFLGPYPFTSRASECSDMELEHVSDEDLCIEVLDQYYNISQIDVEEEDNYPPGCYCYEYSMSPYCYFNKAAGSPRRYLIKRVCKAGKYLLF